MKKSTTTVVMDSDLMKATRIHCIKTEQRFSDYVANLIKADLEKQKKNECA